MNLIPRHNLLDWDHLFDHFWSPSNRSLGLADGQLMPKVEIKDKKKQIILTAELPGVEKDDVHVSIDRGLLTITAESHEEDKEEKDGEVIRQERRYGRYVRSFQLDDSVQDSDIQADFKNGVLKLCIPKGEKPKEEKRRINIR